MWLKYLASVFWVRVCVIWMLVGASYFEGVLWCHPPLLTSRTSLEGRRGGWWVLAAPSLILQLLVLSLVVCSSLWPHPPSTCPDPAHHHHHHLPSSITSTPRPLPPQAAQALPRLLWAFPPLRALFLFFFCSGRGPLSVVVLLHACPVFLHVSSPPAAAIQRRWRRRCWWWWWWCSVSLPSSLLFASSLLCSVNPHCLVVMFELTWMLLFGFSACGSIF